MSKPNNRKLSLFDATTGEQVEVLVTESGKLFHVEGLNSKQINIARKVAFPNNNTHRKDASPPKNQS